MTKQFTVVLRLGEDGMIVASCPAIPGVWTQGKTRAEALANAREAIELAIEAALDRGDPVPDEDVETIEVAV
jgi:predicted RNase H-like HicB family nuclease